MVDVTFLGDSKHSKQVCDDQELEGPELKSRIQNQKGKILKERTYGQPSEQLLYQKVATEQPKPK